MKNPVILLLAAAFISSCGKKAINPPYQSRGVILADTGSYYTCAYCFGLHIEIKNDTTKNAPPYYLFAGGLTDLGLSANTVLPANISLNWHRDTVGEFKSHYYILIDKI